MLMHRVGRRITDLLRLATLPVAESSPKAPRLMFRLNAR
jgi:hypothetical protein